MSDLAWNNRRTISRRSGWPVGVLAECERLDDAHPGWEFWWLPVNVFPGWERPAGFSACRLEWDLVGGNELRREPEDGVRRQPNVFGPDVATLVGKIAAVEERIAAEAAAEERRWASMRRGL